MTKLQWLITVVVCQSFCVSASTVSGDIARIMLRQFRRWSIRSGIPSLCLFPEKKFDFFGLKIAGLCMFLVTNFFPPVLLSCSKPIKKFTHLLGHYPCNPLAMPIGVKFVH